MEHVLVFDPGNSTGWVCRIGNSNDINFGTIFENFIMISDLFKTYQPDSVVFEKFTLYPGAAPSLAHNEFYTCQVIGVIKYLAQTTPSVKSITGISPSSKRYSGGLDERWIEACRDRNDITEHSKDAYLLLKYYEKFHEKAR